MFQRGRHTRYAPLSALVCACAVLLYPAAPAAQRAAQTNASTLPLRRVVLYKAGVGYFEHLARVLGSSQLTMQFTNRQLDDVLNSLTALDLDDGRVVGISYDSTAPLDQRLGALGLQLPANADRAQFYSALRGVRVEVTQGQARTVGRLLGVEHQTRTGPGPIVIDELTVVTDDGRVRTFDLGPTVGVQIADTQLRQDVASYMALVGAARTQDLRQVTISTSGAGTRRLLVSYISEVPVWKATYRLVFPGETATSPVLQGWAIIDNTTADDWTNVDLSLVAGAPQSFVQSISQPYYTQRPIVPLPRTALVRPQVHEPAITSLEESVTVSGASPVVDRMAGQAQGGRGGGIGTGVAQQSATRLGGVAGGLAGGLQAAPPPAAAPPPPPEAPVAVGQPLADLFEYHIQNPVTIRRNQSALVPILSESVEAERVSIWRPLLPDNRPLRGLWLNNSTGLTLDGGTLSIVDGGAFAGEALMETLKPAERRLISYGTDLGLVVSAKNDPLINKITRVAAHDGIVVTTEEDRSRWVYALRNADTTPRTLIIEHPLRTGWTIDPVPGMVESTAGLVRFRLSLDAKAETTFTVMEHRQTGTRISVGDIDEGWIAGWALRGIADSGVRRAIQPIMAKRQEIAAVESQLRSLDGQINGIKTDEQRLRENMQALGPSKDERALRQKYMKALDGNEDRLAALQADFTRVSADRDAKQAELSGLIGTVTFELLGE